MTTRACDGGRIRRRTPSFVGAVVLLWSYLVIGPSTGSFT